MTFDDFLAASWRDHADDEEGVFARLPAGVPLATAPMQLAQLAGLVVHLAGEHLGRWEDGLRVLDGLAAVPLVAGADAAGRSLQRSRAILLAFAGDRAAAETTLAANLDLDRPPGSSRARVLATAASALIARGRWEEGEAAFAEALGALAYGPAADDPAARSLAITANNLAADLEEGADRTPARTALMLRAAEASRRWWGLAGNDSNVLLAEAQWARCLLSAGDPAAALPHALAAEALAGGPEVLAGHRLHALLTLAEARGALGQPTEDLLPRAEAAWADVPEPYRGAYADRLERLRRGA